jgi:hypothetical protein
MEWLDDAIQRLISKPICGYAEGETPSVEPTALATLALMVADRKDQAMASLDWLVGVQGQDGSLGVDAKTPAPCWTTGWAVQAWCMARRRFASPKPEWTAATETAVEWILATSGHTTPREKSPFLGHDTTLRGWPWAAGTHSWVEPTAIQLLALNAAGYAEHPRYREAVELLLNRQLPNGGWNYGNTTVLGHVLFPHVQPTGLALAALAGESNVRNSVQKSFKYLQQSLSEQTTTCALAFALIGLAGHKEWSPKAGPWLAAAYARTVVNPKTPIGRGSPYYTALLVLAAKLWEKQTSLTAHGDVKKNAAPPKK